MLNACLRCSSLFVGVVTLIQAVVWAAIAIWGIAIYDCSATYPFGDEKEANFHSSGVPYLFYVSYLRGSCASKDFSYVAPSAEKAYKMMLTYSIVSSIWVPTSVFLIAGTCLGARGVKATWIYIPWILVTAACCIIDIHATIVFAIQIGDTMTTKEYIKFLAFPNELVQTAMGFGTTVGLDGYTVLPAVIMTVLACRGIIFWIANLFFLIFAIQGICAFSKKKKPGMPRPYAEYENEMRQKDQEHCKEFSKPESVNNTQKKYPGITETDNGIPQFEQGRTNQAFVIDEPLRLNPVEVEVKQERNNHVRYAEVENIQMEPTPEEIRRTPEPVDIDDPETDEDESRVSKINSKLERLEELGLIVPVTKPLAKNVQINNVPEVIEEARGVAIASEMSAPVSESESALEAEDFGNIISQTAPAPPDENNKTEENSPRRVYDVYGNPTEERLTPKVSRIQKIIEEQIKNGQKDVNGYNTRPFSYHQPLQPQVDSVPKKNDTIRGLDKPPIPVPDYSVRVAKKPSFRTPLPNTN